MKTISYEFVDNLLQDFRDYVKGDKNKATGIMSDLILLRSALEEVENDNKTRE